LRIKRCYNAHVLLVELLGFLLIVQEKAFTFLWVGQQCIFARFCFHNFSGVGVGLLLIGLLGGGLLLLIGVLALALRLKGLGK